jgi:hypothetical protein
MKTSKDSALTYKDRKSIRRIINRKKTFSTLKIKGRKNTLSTLKNKGRKTFSASNRRAFSTSKDRPLTYKDRISIIRFINRKKPFSNNYNIIHPYYITGFSDGEGCFFINVRPRPCRNKGYAVELLFKITLSSKDKLLLEKIKDFFGVGRLLSQGSSVSYNVRSLDDKVIVNHFDKYPLISKKYSDYILFRQVFELMKQGQHLNEGLNKIVSIKAVSNRGLSSNLKMLFPKVIPAIRPLVNCQDIPSPH